MRSARRIAGEGRMCLCNMALTLVEEGYAIVGEEGLELHVLRSATAAAAASAFVFSLRGEGAAVLGNLARVWKGFAPEEDDPGGVSGSFFGPLGPFYAFARGLNNLFIWVYSGWNCVC